jgi:hypothetical protein
VARHRSRSFFYRPLSSTMATMVVFTLLGVDLSIPVFLDLFRLHFVILLPHHEGAFVMVLLPHTLRVLLPFASFYFMTCV